MARKRLRVGVVGANGHTDRWGTRAHIPALQALQDKVELLALCTAHPDTARQAAERAGVPRAYSDYRAMFHDPDLDMVTIAVRVPLHHPICLGALYARKHVYCEWPLALDSGQAEELLDVATRQGVRHAVGTQARYSPGVLYLKELIEGGYIGQVQLFNMTQFLPGAVTPSASHRWWLARREMGGSALTIPTGHALDVVRWCLGEVAAVHGRVDTLVRERLFADTGERVLVDSIDTVAFLCRLVGGAVGTVHVSNACHHGGGWRLEVYGEEGKLVASAPGMVQYTQMQLQGARRDEKERSLPVPERFKWVGRLAESEAAFNVAQALMRFLRAIQERTPFHPHFGDALGLHRVLEAVERSSGTGRWEDVVQ